MLTEKIIKLPFGRGKLMQEKTVYMIIAGVSGFFSPLYMLLFWMFAAVLVDLVTGIMAAKKRGEILTSHKMRRTVSKLLSYGITIILFQGIDVHVLPFVNLYAAQLVTAIIVGNDVYSICENLYSITGNRVFYILTQFTSKKISEQTGVDIEKKENEKTVA